MQKFLITYPEIKIVNDRLKAKGYQFFLVGGCVRDFLLGEEPKDIDVVTDAIPDIVEEIFKDFKILSIGKSFGIIKVIFPSGFEMEIATFRSDRYRSSNLQEFVEYIKEKHPNDYEERVNLLLTMSKDETS